MRTPARVQVVPNRDAYWRRIERLKGSSDFFEEQGDSHGSIDADLQDAIEQILVPLVGPWYRSDVWFHNEDFYGNGVRSLTFRVGTFPWKTLGPLQALLVKDAARFCIAVDILDTLAVQGCWVGSVALLQTEVVATPYCAELLQAHGGIEI
jgi:hypothetical protein